MAPILATATGITPQILDNPELEELIVSLKALSIEKIGDELPKLIQLLEPWTTDTRVFEEQVCSRENFLVITVCRAINRMPLTSFCLYNRWIYISGSVL